jgi:hypothetical protein
MVDGGQDEDDDGHDRFPGAAPASDATDLGLQHEHNALLARHNVQNVSSWRGRDD